MVYLAREVRPLPFFRGDLEHQCHAHARSERHAAADASWTATDGSLHARPTPNPGLKALDKLVSAWKVSGETEAELTYEWTEGGFFLIARGDTQQGGRRTKHIEIHRL